jgi:hypothetical protein
MNPIKVLASTGVYGAPPGFEHEIGGLPFWREHDPNGRMSTVYSAWKPSADEIKCLQLGGTVILGIHGMEPIPPVSIGVAWRGRNHDDTPNPDGDDPRAVPADGASSKPTPSDTT